MKELELPHQEPLPIEARQHTQKKQTSIRIKQGCKLFAYNPVNGECTEVRKEITAKVTEVKNDMKAEMFHHKVTTSTAVIYVMAINKANAIRKAKRTVELMSRSR